MKAILTKTWFAGARRFRASPFPQEIPDDLAGLLPSSARIVEAGTAPQDPQAERVARLRAKTRAESLKDHDTARAATDAEAEIVNNLA